MDNAIAMGSCTLVPYSNPWSVVLSSISMGDMTSCRCLLMVGDGLHPPDISSGRSHGGDQHSTWTSRCLCSVVGHSMVLLSPRHVHRSCAPPALGSSPSTTLCVWWSPCSWTPSWVLRHDIHPLDILRMTMVVVSIHGHIWRWP